MHVPPRHLRDLERLFASIRTPREARMLLQDILTPRELLSVAERWQIVLALSKRLPQRTIAEDLRVSISKITRGSRTLKYGSGGFRYFRKKLRMRR